MNSAELPIEYPTLARRIKATFIDGLILPMAAIATVGVLGYAAIGTGLQRAVAAVAVIVLLEPFLVSTTGGSIGHHLAGLRVRQMRVDRKIGFPAAVARLVVKGPLGLMAFALVLLTRQRQAIHDVVVRSLVVYKESADVLPHERVPPLTRVREAQLYAKRSHRLLIIALYWLLAYTTWSLAMVGLLMQPCIRSGDCKATSAAAVLASLLLLLIAFVAVAILGWRGFLYGCRKPSAVAS